VVLQLGDLYYRMGQYDKGLEHFRKGQSLKPNSPEAYHGMGIASQGSDVSTRPSRQ
jgi:Flp pilus assembly protein TadD